MNVVKIYEYYLYTSDIFIVMELLEGGELFNRITQDQKSITFDFIRDVMIQILSALAYMHYHDIGKGSRANSSALRPEAGEYPLGDQEELE